MKKIFLFVFITLLNLAPASRALAHSDHAEPAATATTATVDEHDDEKISLSPADAERFGIRLTQPQSRPISSSIPVIGTLIAIEDARHLVSAAWPATVQKVLVNTGDRVKQHQPLAEVLVRDSLQKITLRAPVDGVVTRRLASAGEAVDGSPLLEITASPDELWFEFSVFPADFSRIAKGQPVYLDEQLAEVRWISPVVNPDGQLSARAMVKTPDHSLRLGQTLRGHWVWQADTAALAVKRTALQTLENATVVFVVHDDGFEAQPVITGRQDGEWIEVLSGLDANDTYASTGSYLLKADLLKSGAEHSH